MAEKHKHKNENDKLWQHVLAFGQVRKETRQKQIMKFLPGNIRCKLCSAPFDGFGGTIAWTFYHKRPANINPQFCTTCEAFTKIYPGGAETELSLLFADVRGSTKMAEQMSPTKFGELINRFYGIAVNVLAKSDALIDKIIGDQASGMYVPGFAGPDHANRAINAGKKILRQTGHGSQEGPWIPLGIGVHTGIAYVGALSDKSGVTDITVLGDVANTAARLSSSAGIGEILISDAAYKHANYDDSEMLEKRDLMLKGKSESISVNVLVI